MEKAFLDRRNHRRGIGANPDSARVNRSRMMAQEPNEYHLVTFDPGGTTGWAHFSIDYRAFSRPRNKILRYLKGWKCGEFSGSEHEQLERACRLMKAAKWGPMPFVNRADFVSEDFDLVQTTGGKNLLSPVRINTVLGWEAHKLGAELILQRRAMRTNVTPERLKLFGFDSPFSTRGWTTTGKGKDAFAAMQHAIVWLKRIKAESMSRPWKLGDSQTANAFWDCRCEEGRRNGKRYRCDITHPR